MHLCEFKASLIYRASSKIAKATQGNPISKTKQSKQANKHPETPPPKKPKDLFIIICKYTVAVFRPEEDVKLLRLLWVGSKVFVCLFFNVDAGKSNSAPHPCAASTSPTKPSPSLQALI